MAFYRIFSPKEPALFEHNCAQRSREIVIRTGSEEQLVLVAILSQPVAEIDSPKLFNVDRRASAVPDRTHELPGNGIEAVDGATVRNASGAAGDINTVADT